MKNIIESLQELFFCSPRMLPISPMAPPLNCRSSSSCNYDDNVNICRLLVSMDQIGLGAATENDLDPIFVSMAYFQSTEHFELKYHENTNLFYINFNVV